MRIAIGDSRKAMHAIESMPYDMYASILDTIPEIDKRYLSPLRRINGSGDRMELGVSATNALKRAYRR
jgi:hypothetical protein